MQQLVFVEGAKEQLIPNAAALEATFDLAMSRRATASTHLNAESSRSHLICTMRMQRRDTITVTTVKSKLSFVDLAGSERVYRSGAIHEKDRLDEAPAINKSLSALGDVISALTTGTFCALQSSSRSLRRPWTFSGMLIVSHSVNVCLKRGSVFRREVHPVQKPQAHRAHV